MILSHTHNQEESLKVISLDFTISDIIFGHVQKACGKTTHTKFITPSSKKEFSSQDQTILGKSSGTLAVRQYKSCSSMAADGRVEAAGHLGSHARLGHVTC